MPEDFDPVAPKLKKALDQDTYHNYCDICGASYIPDINGDSLSCDKCLFRLAFAQRFEVILNTRMTGNPFPHYLFSTHHPFFQSGKS